MIFSLAGRQPQLDGENYVADNARLIGAVHLQCGASVWYNAVLRGDNDELIVGENSNVQDGSILHTDPGFKLRIGANCTIGHMVMLHGCSIGDGSLIGIGSVILNGAQIGRNCLVGARSLITENKQFPDNSLIMGSPAQVVRELKPQEIARLAFTAQVYVQNAQRYREQLRPVGG